MIAGMNRTMSSRGIAELTGKNHKSVMADAEKMLKEPGISFRRLNFQPATKTLKPAERHKRIRRARLRRSRRLGPPRN